MLIMKVVNYGSSYEIYSNDLKTYDKLPVGTYVVRFNPMSGFSLSKREDFVNKEGKIYGARQGKIDKIMRTFNKSERSTGVILSGSKGIGKSLFTQLLSIEALSQEYPVIVVESAYKGIASFIESIDQEVVVMFDEFEKVFDKDKEGTEHQDSLLGLFDGVSQRKRLYVITVNNLSKVSDFMLNRPGRFHYHIRFSYPSSSEVELYLTDKIPTEYQSEIKKVIAFSQRVNLNYDCLRAIAYELSTGEKFEDAILDLNILNTDTKKYAVVVTFTNGLQITTTDRLDMFESEAYVGGYLEGVDSDGDRDSIYFRAVFNPKLARLVNGVLTSTTCSELILQGDVEGIKNAEDVASITFSPLGDTNLHYAV